MKSATSRNNSSLRMVVLLLVSIAPLLLILQWEINNSNSNSNSNNQYGNDAATTTTITRAVVVVSAYDLNCFHDNASRRYRLNHPNYNHRHVFFRKFSSQSLQRLSRKSLYCNTEGDNNESDDMAPNPVGTDRIKSFDNEETLLRISMTVVEVPMVPKRRESDIVGRTTAAAIGVDASVPDDVEISHQQQQHAIDAVAKFCETFPFAAVLPVQPLQYFPIRLVDDDDDDDESSVDNDVATQTIRRRCVEVQFLRKKTPERGSVDGGIRFYIQPRRDDDSGDGNDDERYRSSLTTLTSLPNDASTMIELIAKRNSQGQVITKVFAEQLIITNFVASFLGPTTTVTDVAATGTSSNTSTSRKLLQLQLRYPSPIEQNIVQMQSIFHKWM